LGAIDSLVKPDLIAFAILDITKKPTLDTFRLRHGRDVTFIDIQANQTQETETYKVLVINAEGTAIYALAGRPSPENLDIMEWTKDGAVKLSLKDQRQGVYMDARRIFGFSSLCPYFYTLLGTSPSDSKSCIVLGGRRTDQDTLNPPKLTCMLPQRGSPSLWLNQGEVSSSIIELPPISADVAPLLAVATQERVLLVTSDKLVLITQVSAYLTCDTLISMGSLCVSFFASNNAESRNRSSMQFLCCLNDQFKNSKVASMQAQKQRFYKSLVCLASPRSLFLPTFSSNIL